MKSTFAVAATAALAGSVTAANLHHRHGHELLHGLEKKQAANSTDCGCTTIYSSYFGEPTLIFPPAPPATTSSAAPTTTAAPTTSSETVIVVPTPVPHTCPTTGVYTFAPTTVTLTESTTVCVPSSTALPSGTHVVGGVTTVVTTATTVTCPYATVETSGGVTTSVVKTTEYVCPSSGTYTIAPTTTYVDTPTTITVPSVTTYCPGTYTQPEVVTTVHETNTVVYCPFEPLPTTTETPEAPETTVAPTTAYPTEVAPTTAYPTEVASTTAYPTTAYPTSASKPAPSGSLGGAAGVPWGTTFTPYNPTDGTCMSKERVYAEVGALAAANIKVIRTYSTDCNTLEYVGGAAAKFGIEMILGIFIETVGCSPTDSDIAEQISAIKSWANWDIVPLIIVGNEAALNGKCTPTQLANLITHCKSEFSGYNGKFTTAETVNVWQQPEAIAALCPVVDVACTNAHAFFNTETTAFEAGKFVKGQLEIVEKACGKDAIVGETGWPSTGKSVGAAIASFAEQAIAIHSIIKECGDKSILFSLHNDMWKDPNTDCACEQSWGISSVLGLGM